MRKLIVFSKRFKNQSVEELIKLAAAYQFDGYDLCVRPGYAVNPENVRQKLPQAVKQMSKEGLAVPMITGNGNLLSPDDPSAEAILVGMDQADVRLLKLGYFVFDPLKHDYWQEVDRIRKCLEKWEKLAGRYNVKICYHTHYNRCMGLNCAALMHLIEGRDPRYIGAYIDPGHMVLEGEEFCVGAAMVKRYLSIVALKDVLIQRSESAGHGAVRVHWVPASLGMVNWTAVFSELARINFEGPLSVHCEFKVEENEFNNALKQEITFFKDKLNESLKKK